MTIPDADVDRINTVLSRVTFCPGGGAALPIRAEIRSDGHLGLVHKMCAIDSRGHLPLMVDGRERFTLGTTTFQRPAIGDPFSVENIGRNVALHVATTSAHEALEWLRIDGELIFDPHADGEPVVSLPMPSRAKRTV